MDFDDVNEKIEEGEEEEFDLGADLFASTEDNVKKNKKIQKFINSVVKIFKIGR